MNMLPRIHLTGVAHLAAPAAAKWIRPAGLLCAMAVVAIAVCTAVVRADTAGTAADAAPQRAAEAADRAWRFRVHVDDKVIGFHDFTLGVQDGRQVLRSVADFEYKLLFLTLYRYEHENREIWEGDCLAQIDARTDANGKTYAVEGRRQPDAFVVQGSKGENTLPHCIMSCAYWNPAVLEATPLLNTQNGEYLDVHVSEPVRDQLEVGGEMRPSWRYRLEAGALELELWYSDDREWLGLQTRYENGRTLRYELVTDSPDPTGSVVSL